jgi:hypothetical protein
MAGIIPKFKGQRYYKLANIPQNRDVETRCMRSYLKLMIMKAVGSRDQEPGTRNQESGTRNQEPGTRNEELGTSYKPLATRP